MSDQTLSLLNLVLQWVAVLGSIFALVSAIGLIFARKEISSRQSEALQAAGNDAASARSLAGILGAEVERVKKYSYIATLTFNGSVSVEGDVIFHTPISRAVEGTWAKVAPERYRPACDEAALKKSQKAIAAFPEFPFTYYSLAYCLQKKGDIAWRGYAEKAVSIFEATTQINGHQESHDQCLNVLRGLLAAP